MTAINGTRASSVTVWALGTNRPLPSDLYWIPGRTVPNLVMAKLGDNGQINIYNHAGSVDVIVAVEGWYS